MRRQPRSVKCCPDAEKPGDDRAFLCLSDLRYDCAKANEGDRMTEQEQDEALQQAEDDRLNDLGGEDD